MTPRRPVAPLPELAEVDAAPLDVGLRELRRFAATPRAREAVLLAEAAPRRSGPAAHFPFRRG